MLSQADFSQLRARFHPYYDQLAFGPIEAVLQCYLRPGALVLDAGAGRGTWILRRHRKSIGFWVGVDLSFPCSREENACVAADLRRLPFAGAAFDLVICYHVVEHLKDPAGAFAGFARVLRPGGLLIIKTPNLRSPFMAMARLSPFSWQRFLKRRLGAPQEEIFPIVGRCNTASSLHRELTAAEFVCRGLWTVDQTCEYFTFNRVAYALGLLFSRLMQALPAARWRSSLIAVYVR